MWKIRDFAALLAMWKDAPGRNHYGTRSGAAWVGEADQSPPPPRSDQFAGDRGGPFPLDENIPASHRRGSGQHLAGMNQTIGNCAMGPDDGRKEN